MKGRDDSESHLYNTALISYYTDNKISIVYEEVLSIKDYIENEPHSKE